MTINDPRTPIDPTPPDRPPQMAGGCLIAVGVLLGPVLGALAGQITLGLVAGLIVGALAAIVFALAVRR